MKALIVTLLIGYVAPLGAQQVKPDPRILSAAVGLRPASSDASVKIRLDVDRAAARSRGAMIGAGLGALLYFAIHNNADAGGGSTGVAAVMIGGGALLGAALGSNSAAQAAGGKDADAVGTGP